MDVKCSFQPVCAAGIIRIYRGETNYITEFCCNESNFCNCPHFEPRANLEVRDEKSNENKGEEQKVRAKTKNQKKN